MVVSYDKMIMTINRGKDYYVFMFSFNRIQHEWLIWVMFLSLLGQMGGAKSFNLKRNRSNSQIG